jgi:hypothetical protein
MEFIWFFYSSNYTLNFRSLHPGVLAIRRISSNFARQEIPIRNKWNRSHRDACSRVARGDFLHIKMARLVKIPRLLDTLDCDS